MLFLRIAYLIIRVLLSNDILSYGLIYLVVVTLPEIYGGIYGQSTGIAGLHYIALGIGFIAASRFNARTLDRIYRYFTAKNGGVGRPEYSLPSIFIAALLLPSGLLIYGWTTEKHVFWLFPNIGIMLAGYRALGYGKGGTVLAVCAIVLGWPAPFLFWRYGEKIRAKSRYARKQ
ncbi:hypothetical protein M422DRAFT_246198 [Sphaerobolus stellatus SS14]|nr:hypothetical protein M422DRAFT_246198 [Sphaerobolus stellatus SS14]